MAVPHSLFIQFVLFELFSIPIHCRTKCEFIGILCWFLKEWIFCLFVFILSRPMKTYLIPHLIQKWSLVCTCDHFASREMLGHYRNLLLLSVSCDDMRMVGARKWTIHCKSIVLSAMKKTDVLLPHYSRYGRVVHLYEIHLRLMSSCQNIIYLQNKIKS